MRRKLQFADGFFGEYAKTQRHKGQERLNDRSAEGRLPEQEQGPLDQRSLARQEHEQQAAHRKSVVILLILLLFHDFVLPLHS